MAIVYKNCGGGTGIPAPVCEPCAPREHGRVRSIAFIKKGTALANPAVATEWLAGIQAGTILIIPETTGTFDGGTPKEGKGYGNRKVTVLGYDYVINASDPNYTGNAKFWDAIKDSGEYQVAFRTETQVHISDEVVTITPKNQVEEDVESEVVWLAEIKWFQPKLMKPQSAAALTDVFRCFEVTAGV